MTGSGKARVLAVEDNADTRTLLKHLLQTRYDLVLTGRVDEALEAADGHRFDLFLLDINLGEARTGVDLLHILRGNPAHAATPAIAITAYALPGDRDQFIASGFNGYLSKPFNRAALTAAIEDLLLGNGER